MAGLELSEDLSEILTQELLPIYSTVDDDFLDSLFSQVDLPDVDVGNGAQLLPTNSREEDELDWLFSQVPDSGNQVDVRMDDKNNDRFTVPKSSSEIEAAKAKAIPCNTTKNTKWAVNIWKEWSESRKRVCQLAGNSDSPPHLFLCTIGNVLLDCIGSFHFHCFLICIPLMYCLIHSIFTAF